MNEHDSNRLAKVIFGTERVSLMSMTQACISDSILSRIIPTIVQKLIADGLVTDAHYLHDEVILEVEVGKRGQVALAVGTALHQAIEEEAHGKNSSEA